MEPVSLLLRQPLIQVLSHMNPIHSLGKAIVVF